MNQIYTQYHKTPYGELVLGSFDKKLCLCDWRYRKMRAAINRRLTKSLEAIFVERDNKVLYQTRQQLEEYFNLERKEFNIPLLLVGTVFQKRVWDELVEVAYGNTASYLELAERIGNKSAVRAVAGANGSNAISIIVPCHRIIGRRGELVGYAGGLLAKKKLLELEREGNRRDGKKLENAGFSKKQPSKQTFFKFTERRNIPT